MTDRDELFETMGRIEGEGAGAAECERMVLSLLRGEAQIGGARVRIEWVDPKPDWIDRYVDRRSVEMGASHPAA
jgi:hypothetical protein